jgi:putative FmdB family regulatory protein
MGIAIWIREVNPNPTFPHVINGRIIWKGKNRYEPLTLNRRNITIFKIMNIMSGRSIMPMYEYSCTKCGQRFEKLEKKAATETVACPNCGSTEVSKEISSFSSTGSTSIEFCGNEG